mgnify:CR=1 FL=1
MDKPVDHDMVLVDLLLPSEVLDFYRQLGSLNNKGNGEIFMLEAIITYKLYLEGNTPEALALFDMELIQLWLTIMISIESVQ